MVGISFAGLVFTVIASVPLDPERLGRLVRLVDSGTISGKIAKEVFEQIYDSGEQPEEVIRKRGITGAYLQGA